MNVLKKVVPFLAILILLLIIKNNVFSIHTTLTNDHTTESMKETIAQKKKENEYLRQRLYYVKSREFVEEEAIQKLGMLKAGEYFVIAPTPGLAEPDSNKLDDRPNWKRWLELFF